MRNSRMLQAKFSRHVPLNDKSDKNDNMQTRQ